MLVAKNPARKKIRESLQEVAREENPKITMMTMMMENLTSKEMIQLVRVIEETMLIAD